MSLLYRRRPLAGLVIVTLSLASGCAEVVDEANEHPACVLPSDPGNNFMVDPEGGPFSEYMADAPVWVGVDHGCAPCGDNLEIGCTVELEGDELIVESTFNYEDPRGSCGLACGLISSKCQTSDPLPAGSYTIRYGDRTAMLEVPSQGEAPCFPRL